MSLTIAVDTILVENEGFLAPVVRKLSSIIRPFEYRYPADDNHWWSTDDAATEYLELVKRIDDQAPDGYYFGSHPTQPQCLGFWKTNEIL
jgi:hypothetical protein